MSLQSECPDEVVGTDIEELFRQAELAKMTTEQRISYEYSIMSRNDMLNSMYEAVEAAREEAQRIGLAEGRAEGRSEGRAEGKTEAHREIARRMLDMGMPVDQIAAITMLSAEEIVLLKS